MQPQHKNGLKLFYWHDGNSNEKSHTNHIKINFNWISLALHKLYNLLEVCDDDGDDGNDGDDRNETNAKWSTQRRDATVQCTMTNKENKQITLNL